MFGIPIVGDLLSAGASLIGGERANRANIQMARENRAFQESMSSTSYQRAMDDMRSAGLNPMLAYDKGGASTPPGSTAQVSDIITPAISTAMQKRRLDQEIEVMKSSEYKNLREGALANALKIKATEDSVNSALTAEHLKYALPKARNLAEAEDKIGDDLAPIDRILQTIGLGSRTVSGVLK